MKDKPHKQTNCYWGSDQKNLI